MGEVYKAKDTRLERMVAIKVLPEHLAESPERKARFEREAKAISQLNHPNICTLYDVGEQDGVGYLVMEYIEGETLAERLKRGPLTLAEALEYGIQILDGLDTAHRAGIVHRDLKPANVMLTKSGVKLLDFGLARLITADSVADSSDAPTRQKDLTKEESIIGTLHYMSPEQLEGRVADARADIWAFGALLHEMLTGEKTFTGASQASLIAAILEREPTPVSELRSDASKALDRSVRRCLEKDVDDRWQTAKDLREVLRWVGEAPGEEPAPRRLSTPNTSFLAVAVGGVLLGVLSAWSLLRNTGEPALVIRTSITLPEGQELILDDARASSPIVLSPDGSQLVYVATFEQETHLFVRSLAEFDSRVVPGTIGASRPFFSPDGEWIGFLAGRELKKAALSGGLPITIAEVGDVTAGATWGPNDTIVFANHFPSYGLMRVGDDGESIPQALTSDDATRGAPHRLPHFLPGGQALVFYIRGEDDNQLALLDLRTNTWKELGLEGTGPRYLSTGHLLFARSGALFSAPFDVDRGEIVGPAVPALESIHLTAFMRDPYVSVSESGTLIYLDGRSGSSMVRLGRDGTVLPLTETGHFQWPRLSPDGNRLAVNKISERGLWDMWVYDVERGSRARLAEGGYLCPVWTSDGDRVFFAHPSISKTEQESIVSAPADASEAPEVVLQSNYQIYPWSLSPDDRFLAYYQVHPDTQRDLHYLDLSSGTSTPFLVTKFNETRPMFSPNGQFVAYTSNESGRDEVYVRSFPGPGVKFTVSTEGGREPRWSGDGTQLFYVQGRALRRVTVEIDGGFHLGKPELFDTRQRAVNFAYDVAHDGESLVLVSSGSTPNELRVVLNFDKELERLVPRDK